jgi:hypothetical protein
MLGLGNHGHAIGFRLEHRRVHIARQAGRLDRDEAAQ